jgi:hypothetical protein
MKMEMVKAFRCAHSGLYFPGDYTKEWGRKYGIGLGPVPVSECFDSAMNSPVCIPESGDMSKAMHPIGVTHAQVDFCMVPKDEYEANRLILHSEDKDHSRRAKILRDNQIAKGGRLASMVREEIK